MVRYDLYPCSLPMIKAYLTDFSRPLEVCVDVGCGRGYVTRHLSGPGQGRSIKKVYALEMSKSMLDQMEYPPEEEGIEVETILMDEDSAR